MTTTVASRPRRKFLGNVYKMEVHELAAETADCQVDEIVDAGHGVTFTPDTLEQAHLEAFDNCAYCLGDSTR